MHVKLGPYPTGKGKRRVKIKVHPYDTYNLDHTLALVIHPLLQQLAKSKHGAGPVDDEDVPTELTKASAPPTENDWTPDDNFFKRWDWVLSEMIWAFDQLGKDDPDDQFFAGGKLDHAAHDQFWARVQNGLRLFAKYYRGLWD